MSTNFVQSKCIMTIETNAINKTSEEKKNEKKRDKWNSKTEYILSCLGYAIGIGNVWRFPYLCYRNGGGAFLVPYLSMLFICGIPLYFMETCWGQFGTTGCLTMFKMAPLFKGVGYAIVVVNIICTTYYNVIISYPLLFLFKSMRFQLPWSDCNNSWNTERCLKLDGAETSSRYLNNSLLDQSLRLKTPADEFFQ